MDLNTLKDTPPWEWPESAGKLFLEVLTSDEADVSDRITAADLAGDFTVVNDELAHALLSILRDSEESEELRARAAISLGPALEGAYNFGSYFPEDVPISEETFNRIQECLRGLHMENAVPKVVRRRVLEASVRSPQEWHRAAVGAAYSSDEEDWRLTAVFCMQYVTGFDDAILESLESENPNIRYQAVLGAGARQLDAAWPHVVSLLTSVETDKDLALAAIEAAVEIRPGGADEVLADLLDAEDKEIADAALEAITLAEGLSCEEELDDD